MEKPLQSLMNTGTKLWLDSIDPDLVRENRSWGVTGATSNPVIISDVIKSGKFDTLMERFFEKSEADSEVAWLMTDHLVKEAQQVFQPVWESTCRKRWLRQL